MNKELQSEMNQAVAEFSEQLNRWGQDNVPFFFMVDFEMKKPHACRLADINTSEILFEVNGFSNIDFQDGLRHHKEELYHEIIKKIPIQQDEYILKFNKVLQRLAYGDSFLTNLTIDTEVQLSHSLKEIFYVSAAKYKLWYKNDFLVFSPETFVQIRDAKIYSYPMKGTIDASLPAARARILTDQKELAEHITIVDLIRNDLSRISDNVSVKRFRYIDELKTNQKTLLQVSSEIVGELPHNYSSHLGDILVTLLPAGSVSGAPKPKTLEIIREAEACERGYYTGVFGYYDGTILDSGVMIRFIERRHDGYVYRSGGGITTQSLPEAEYQEAIDKVYVPVN